MLRPPPKALLNGDDACPRGLGDQISHDRAVTFVVVAFVAEQGDLTASSFFGKRLDFLRSTASGKVSESTHESGHILSGFENVALVRSGPEPCPGFIGDAGLSACVAQHVLTEVWFPRHRLFAHINQFSDSHVPQCGNQFIEASTLVTDREHGGSCAFAYCFQDCSFVACREAHLLEDFGISISPSFNFPKECHPWFPSVGGRIRAPQNAADALHNSQYKARIPRCQHKCPR